MKKERYADGMGKMRGATVAVINHPRSYSGDPFRFLLAKRRSPEQPGNGSAGGSPRGAGNGEGFHPVADEMQFFARNKTLQDSGDGAVILLD